jgi:hypothetical protein
VHVEQLERRLPSPRLPEEADLERLLRRWRWQFGLERLAMAAVRGALASSLALIGIAFAIWLSQAQSDRTLLWLSAAPLLAAVGLSVLRWPSHHLTAITVDHRLGLDERMATALELSQNETPGRFAALQLRDARVHARSARPTRLALDARARNEALLLLPAVLLATAALVLVPHLPRPVPTTPSVAEAVSPDLPAPADEQAQRAFPLDTPDASATSPGRPQTALPPADLAARVQQEQAERSALDKLAQALSNDSAGQPAASAIQQGDFNAARDQLQSLADDADQLSDAAKQQLARDLKQAAAATTQSDRALADREQQASQALARSNYADQRQALSALADQVQRSGTQSVPSDQLERDQGQLQQQQTSTSTSAASQSSAASSRGQTGAGQQGAGQSAQTSGSQGAADQGSAAAGAGQGGSGAGQQAGAGVGTGSDPDLYSSEPSRLETSGQRVEVPTRLGNGPGVRPANGTEDQQLPDPTLSGRTASELGQSQETGQVAPEQNLVPGEQRSVVRGYFR